jgi:hypothetical protein
MRFTPVKEPIHKSLDRRTSALLASPVNGASLAAFRIAFGLVLCWHVARYLWPQSGTSMAEYLYVTTPWNFSYPGFAWVQPWPQPWLNVHFLLVGLAGLCVAVGFCYRAAAVTLFLSFSYTFLWEQAKYNNHYYLMCLIAFLLIWMPAQSRFSVDAWRRWRAARGPIDAEPLTTTEQIPFWPIFLLRAQLFIVYFYAGVAKINGDWLAGIPLSVPAGRFHGILADFGLSGLASVEQVCLFLAWFGLTFDLAIGFLLIMPRTRWLAILMLAGFHGTNHFMFDIGVFPVMAFLTTLIFFQPDWPLRFARWLKQPKLARPDWGWFAGGLFALPLVGAALGWRSGEPRESPELKPKSLGRPVMAFLLVWLAAQVLIPLRHYAIAGDANWTEEGQRFAWRMKLRAKAAGHIMYQLHDSGLQEIDTNGKKQFAWDRWPDEHAIYVPVEPRLFRWENHFGLNMTHEPCVGQRTLFVPFGESDEALENKRAELIDTWQTRFGREIEVHETISLKRVLSELRTKLKSLPTNTIADNSIAHRNCLAHVEVVGELIDRGDGGNEYQRESHWILIVNHLSLVADSPFADVTLPILRRMHPFALQGAAFSRLRFLVVEDSHASDKQRDLALRKLGSGKPYLVWVDLSRLRPDDWRQMPRAFVTFDDKDLKIVWNHFRELNHIQLERFSVRPEMIRQYARRIAGEWEAETGRKPQVFAFGSVMLNYRRPLPLVDPETDLASVEYSRWSHNAWILPHAARVSDQELR